MEVAALVLTGGRSRRMGRDKATLPLPGGDTLAGRTAAILTAVATGPTLEVGPGATELEAVSDLGVGPLGAIAAGTARLRALGWDGSALVLATDLPRIDASLLAWLAAFPTDGSVVPVSGRRPQWLAARYSPEALDAAENLATNGFRAVRDLVEGRPLHLAAEVEWRVVSDADVLADVDDPADLARLGLDLPPLAAR